MNKKREELTPKQITALTVLSLGQSHKEAAKEAGVNNNTITLWMKDETFRNELRLYMERRRQQFESRVMQVANNAMVVVQELLTDKNQDVRAKGAQLALNAAVRLSTRYKELQVEGYVPPQPLVVFPPGTRLPWAQKALAAPEHTEISDEDDVIDVEASERNDSTGQHSN